MSIANAPQLDRSAEKTDRVGNPYGRFAPDGAEYQILDYRTPRPWVNIASTPRMGFAVSQTGAGFTWIDNSQLAVITRWQQEFVQDNTGKLLYIRDLDSGEIWSLAPAPTFPIYDRYVCRHGLGYTVFETERAGIRAAWTLVCHPQENVELWHVELTNLGNQTRRLELTSYLEWNCGVQPAPRREFHKIFLETELDRRRRAVFARNHMWDVPNAEHGHWNTDFPYVSAFACSEPLLSAQGDKTEFLGRYGDFKAPEALTQETWAVRFGRHDDAIAALRCAIDLKPERSRAVGYALAVADSRTGVEHLLDHTFRADAIPGVVADVSAQWRKRLATHRITVPDATFNHVVNDWVRYQAISGRIWGRAGYYQQSGAYGFRDQLQDSQIWLTIDPAQCRAHVNLAAKHQFADGSVYHWWHPLSEMGHVTRMTDDLLWLSFVIANYIKETGDSSILFDTAPFIDDAHEQPLVDHVLRAFRRVFSRTSPRGLPLIGAGDWNDGLSACGLKERGESIWLGQFLAGLLTDWIEIFQRLSNANGRLARAGLTAEACVQVKTHFEKRRANLIAAINEHGWDGEWYWRATLDDGRKLGSSECRVGRIFLNAQTWAILNDIAPPARAKACWTAVCEHLVTPAGALLLAPAYDQPDPLIGYITRYAPGLRENGGVYSHAATWAIAAAAKMKDRDTVGRLLTAINPANKDADKYCSEPYVMPGNVDGPQSPYHGRAGWSWYTGSAAWLQRIVTQWVLGVRPEWDGLRIDPCLPAGWTEARMVRPWRGSQYHFRIEQRPGGSGAVEVTLDGARVNGTLLSPSTQPGGKHEVVVRVS